jgi:flagellum-specific ATP synthase
MARQFKKYLALYLENRDLLLMGGYESGQDPDLDIAISLWPKLKNHIEQTEHMKSSFNESKSSLLTIFEG